MVQFYFKPYKTNKWISLTGIDGRREVTILYYYETDHLTKKCNFVVRQFQVGDKIKVKYEVDK